MTNQHSYSFFGQKSALFFQSPSRTVQHLFFRFIKKKNDGTWEKPSNGEGTVIKLSLEEQVQILEVLEKEQQSWSGFHAFKGQKTSINMNWENIETNRFWIKIGRYAKMLRSPEIKILTLLMKHVLQEKIEYATQNSYSKKKSEDDQEELSNSNESGKMEAAYTKKTSFKKNDNIEKNSKENADLNNQPIIEQKILSKDYGSFQGKIKGETEKALLIITEQDNEHWIPKSTIKASFDSNNKGTFQNFIVENWIITKNNIAV